MADLAVHVQEAFSDALDAWLDSARVVLNVQQRVGCWCQNTTKPCEVHDAFDDGICALIDVLQGVRAVGITPSEFDSSKGADRG